MAQMVSLLYTCIMKFRSERLATLCKNLVNFSPVTPEFKTSKDVHPLVNQQFGFVCLVAPLLDGIVGFNVPLDTL